MCDCGSPVSHAVGGSPSESQETHRALRLLRPSKPPSRPSPLRSQSVPLRRVINDPTVALSCAMGDRGAANCRAYTWHTGGLEESSILWGHVCVCYPKWRDTQDIALDRRYSTDTARVTRAGSRRGQRFVNANTAPAATRMRSLVSWPMTGIGLVTIVRHRSAN